MYRFFSLVLAVAAVAGCAGLPGETQFVAEYAEAFCDESYRCDFDHFGTREACVAELQREFAVTLDLCRYDATQGGQCIEDWQTRHMVEHAQGCGTGYAVCPNVFAPPESCSEVFDCSAPVNGAAGPGPSPS